MWGQHAHDLRTHWLEIEEANLSACQANLEALRAWKAENRQLQDKWTEEMLRRCDVHSALLDKWKAMR